MAGDTQSVNAPSLIRSRSADTSPGAGFDFQNRKTHATLTSSADRLFKENNNVCGKEQAHGAEQSCLRQTGRSDSATAKKEHRSINSFPSVPDEVPAISVQHLKRRCPSKSCLDCLSGVPSGLNSHLSAEKYFSFTTRTRAHLLHTTVLAKQKFRSPVQKRCTSDHQQFA